MLRGAKINAEWIGVPTADEIKAKDHDRLLEKLLKPVELDEADLALGTKLLETMTPENIAASLVATHRAKMPAAEDMLDDGKRERTKETHRDGFDDAQWFRINVGRSNNADPKWILPLMCRRGGVTRNDIGAIRIMGDESYVAIAAKAANQFASSVARTVSAAEMAQAAAIKGAAAAAARIAANRTAKAAAILKAEMAEIRVVAVMAGMAKGALIIGAISLILISQNPSAANIKTGQNLIMARRKAQH
jgi:ATP-dependent RNA helicase DeaD